MDGTFNSDFFTILDKKMKDKTKPALKIHKA